MSALKLLRAPPQTSLFLEKLIDDGSDIPKDPIDTDKEEVCLVHEWNNFY